MVSMPILNMLPMYKARARMAASTTVSSIDEVGVQDASLLRSQTPRRQRVRRLIWGDRRLLPARRRR